MSSLLHCQNLSFSIEQKKILSSLNLTINEGKIIALLGESGSGKSTLLHLLAGLEEPTEGVIIYKNSALPPPSKKLVAGHPEIKLVKQDFGLFPNISLRENIAYELRFFTKEYQEERIGKLLKIGKLEAVSHRLPRQVSGGEQQRCVIAKAIADEPSVLLLDEPFSHLDRLNKLRLKEEIQRIIFEEKMACVFVTHDVSDAYGLADELIIIQNGVILQQDTPLAVYNLPSNKYVAEITGEVNLLSSAEMRQFIGSVEANKTYLIRPEWLTFEDEGFEFEIEKIDFLGSYFLSEVKVRNLKITVQSTKNPSLFLYKKLRINIFQEIN
jgi:ABC-type Fe3+/spermidine/putrescine transport system ATPase subunit